MRVAYVINALGEGGTERSLADLLPGLRDRGVDISILTLRTRGDEGVEPVLRAQGFDIRTLGGQGHLRTARAMRSALASIDPDIVHTMLFEANVLACVTTVGLRARVVTSLVNTSYSPERFEDPRLNRVKLRAVQLVEMGLARWRTHQFHAVSNAVKEDARRGLRIAPERITVIPRGRRTETLRVPSAREQESYRAELGIDRDAEVLVAVGRQEYQKGHCYLLEAMQMLRDRHDLVLLVAGREGNETDNLRRQLRRMPEAGSRTRFLGHCNDILPILSAADVFVFPSLFEGMPGAVIEAMGCGLPVVASDIPPVAETVARSENAELVPPRDPAALAEAITGLLDEPYRRTAMGHRSREIFESSYAISHSVEGLLKLYESVRRGAPT